MEKTRQTPKPTLPPHPEVKVMEKPVLCIRMDGNRHIYSVGTTDLIARDPAHPHFYEVLTDCPAYDYRAGTMRVLSAPFDANAVDTASAMARSLGLLE